MLQDLAPLIPTMPRIIDRIDPDGLVDTLFAARGVPAAVSRSRAEADAIGAERTKAQQMAQGMGAMQAGAGALKDAALAQQAMSGAQAPQGQGAGH